MRLRYYAKGETLVVGCYSSVVTRLEVVWQNDFHRSLYRFIIKTQEPISSEETF